MNGEQDFTIAPSCGNENTLAYYRARDGRIRYVSRRAWNDLPLDVLTEACTRLDIERLLDLGYVLQSNANGTITFWHLHLPLDTGSWTQKSTHIQLLINAGVLQAAETDPSPDITTHSLP